MLAALPPELLGRLALPADRADQARGAGDRRAPRPRRSPRKPESQDLCFLAGQGKRGFLRRHGGLARPRRATSSTARGRALGRHRGHHNFTVGQRRGIGVSAPRAALRARHRRRRQHGHRRHPRGARDRAGSSVRDAVLHRDGARVDAVRLRYHSRAAAGRRSAPPAAGRHDALEVELGEDVRRRLARARPRCCWRARRSSATARSPPRPEPPPAAAQILRLPLHEGRRRSATPTSRSSRSGATRSSPRPRWCPPSTTPRCC